MLQRLVRMLIVLYFGKVMLMVCDIDIYVLL